jgi:peptide/nickel transport system permease protein
VPAAVLLVIAVLGGLAPPWSPVQVVAGPDLAPSGAHWFGTDTYGMDVFSRTVAATRNNVAIGALTALAATVIGIAIGLVVGMCEARPDLLGRTARVLGRSLDLVQAVPAIIIGMVLVAFFGSTIPTLVLALTVVLTPNQARLVRAEVLKVRSDAYLDAARMSGEREIGLVLRHVLPNSSWPALENVTLVFASAIVLTAALGFLGVGLNPPTPEWGSMIAVGASSAGVGRWWPAFFPTLALAFSVLAVATAGKRYFDS